MKFNKTVDILEDTPFECAEKLLTGKADIGLVPVAVLPNLLEHYIISEYCIGADGAVNSVMLFSDVPINRIKTILLDYQSQTSILLARILALKYWNIDPFWQSTSADYENKIKDETAGIVIGDRALLLKNKFPFAYDLSGEWKKFTGLPFVFACWVSVHKLENKFLLDFNHALENGLKKINDIARLESSTNYSEEKIRNYLTRCIDYKFDEKKQEAMDLFLKMAKEIV